MVTEVQREQTASSPLLLWVDRPTRGAFGLRTGVLTIGLGYPGGYRCSPGWRCWANGVNYEGTCAQLPPIPEK